MKKKKKKKRKKYDHDNCNILLPVCFKHPILQIIRFTDMKVCLYAGDMNLNRKYEKSMWKYKKKKNDFVR